MPDIYIICGPNGAGKTTLAMTLLPKFLHLNEFVNADNIAAGLSPLNAESQLTALQAGKLMLKRIDWLVGQRESFAFETTLASRIFVPFIKKAQNKGYKVNLIFVWINSYKKAQQRVALRVKKGGHFVPDDVVKRRYYRGMYNLKKLYTPIVDDWIVYNNVEKPVKIVAFNKFGIIEIIDKTIWNTIEEVEL